MSDGSLIPLQQFNLMKFRLNQVENLHLLVSLSMLYGKFESCVQAASSASECNRVGGGNMRYVGSVIAPWVGGGLLYY